VSEASVLSTQRRSSAVSGVRGFSGADVEAFAVDEVETRVGVAVGEGVGDGDVLGAPHDATSTAANVAATMRWEGRVMLG
jgi:hypothetical protein